jgi:hypothetical protein
VALDNKTRRQGSGVHMQGAAVEIRDPGAYTALEMVMMAAIGRFPAGLASGKNHRAQLPRLFHQANGAVDRRDPDRFQAVLGRLQEFRDRKRPGSFGHDVPEGIALARLACGPKRIGSGRGGAHRANLPPAVGLVESGGIYDIDNANSIKGDSMNRKILAALALSLFAVACEDSNVAAPQDDHEHEVITTVSLKIANKADASDTASVRFFDADGEGGKAPVSPGVRSLRHY